MAFSDHELSVQLGRPVFLYKFEFSVTEIFYLTNSQVEIGSAPEVYLPCEVGHSQPRVNEDEPGSEITISFGLDDENANTFANNWISAAPEVDRIKVTITRFHSDVGGGSALFWIGFLTSVGYEEQGNVASVLCKSLDQRFTLTGPRKNWGTLCNHKLYGTECTLDNASFTQEGTVSAIDASGIVYTVPGISAPTVRWDGGTIQLKSNPLIKRLIVSQTGDDFTLRYPIPELTVGSLVEVVEGCLHDVTDCQSFSNLPNFGGTPFTPTRNPFTNRVDFL